LSKTDKTLSPFSKLLEKYASAFLGMLSPKVRLSLKALTVRRLPVHVIGRRVLSIMEWCYEKRYKQSLPFCHEYVKKKSLIRMREGISANFFPGRLNGEVDLQQSSAWKESSNRASRTTTKP